MSGDHETLVPDRDLWYNMPIRHYIMTTFDTKHYWWASAIIAVVGLIIVTTNMSPSTEMIYTVVETVHSAAKAKDGEQY